MPRGLEESFLEFPIPRRTQEAIANFFWGDTEFQLQPYFQYYTDQCRLAVQSYDILKDVSLQDVKVKLLELCSQQNEAYSEDNLHASIHLAVRLIFMPDVGEFRNAFSGRRKLVWRNGPLKTFIEEIFSKEIHLEHERIKLGPVFNVCNIVRIGGFKVELTTNLADHLLLRDADRTLTIFHHASYLMSQRQSPLFPDGLADETLRTLALLFPQGDRNVEKWYKRQDSHEELDYNVLKCGSANRHIEGYKYWHDRLFILKEAFDESRPSTISQWWNDWRDGVQWYALWIAISLTVFFGLVQSIEGALQAYKAYHPSSSKER
ncbi:Hypothetical protein PENO1_031420 [Penicillium occitanis (nom. inval.)]|nr:Hypothetical protein PENO1_031420 [Penicillium occitanis (nom. inval.)]